MSGGATADMKAYRCGMCGKEIDGIGAYKKHFDSHPENHAGHQSSIVQIDLFQTVYTTTIQLILAEKRIVARSCKCSLTRYL